jgi:hypothetical protein
MDVTKDMEQQRQQLLKHVQDFEKSLEGWSIEKFSELRYQLKQVKEKLRSLDKLSRTNCP